MKQDFIKMNPLSIKIGFLSSLFFTIMGIGYAIGLGTTFSFFSMPSWTDIHSYASFIKSMPGTFFTICQITAFLAGPIFIMLLCSIYDFAKNEKKVLIRIGICFGIIFVVLMSMCYFVQLTVIPQNIYNGQLDGLEQFVELNTKSFMASMVVLGYSLFLGLASLFIAPAFYQSRLEKSICLFLIIGGISSILELIGSLLPNLLMLSIAFTGIANVSLIIVGILLCILFGKIQKYQREHKTDICIHNFTNT